MKDDENMDIGYAQYLDRKPICWRGIESFEQPFAGGIMYGFDSEGNTLEFKEPESMYEDYVSREFENYVKETVNETRLYNCGGLPVSLNLPRGEHDRLGK